METLPPPEKIASGRKEKRPGMFLTGMLALALWMGLIYSAYYYSTSYFENAIRNVQETNAMHVQTLEDRLDNIQSELAVVQEALADTDQTLARTDTTREELSQRIEKLDRQLEQLQESLNILRKSPDANS